jgi:WD40 repeat protein
VTEFEELQTYAEILRSNPSIELDAAKKQELVFKGILAALEEIAAVEGEAAEPGSMLYQAAHLLYEAAGTHPNENIRNQALRALIRLGRDGKHPAIDLVYLLAVEKDLLPARQAISSHGWDPTRAELRALLDWFTTLASGTAFPAEEIGLITQAYFQTASPDLQKRLLASAADNKMKNWAMIITKLQEGSQKSLAQLVEDYAIFSSQERLLAINQLEQRALEGLQTAQEALCSMFLDQDDEQAKTIILRNHYCPADPERRALLFFLLEDWPAYNRLDFDHSLLTNIYETANRPMRRRLMEHSRKTGQIEWLRGLGQVGEVRWPNDLTDADWELAIKRLNEGDKKADLWRLSQSAPPFWSAHILDHLAKSGWMPGDTIDSSGFLSLTAMAEECLRSPLTIRPKKALHTLSADITCLAIAPDGKLLAAGGSDQRITLWDLPEGDLHPGSLLVPTPVTRSLALDPAGEMIACASSDHRIRVFNLHNGQMIKTLEGHRAMIRALVIHPNGRMMFSAGFDGEIRFWRFPSGPELKTIQPGSGEIFSLAITGAGQAIISGGIDRQARVWTIPEGAQARQISFHTDTITHLASSTAAELVASAGRDGKICLWNSSSGGLIHTIENQSGPVTSLCQHPNDQVLVSGHQSGTITLWNLSSGKAIDQLTGHRDPINGLVFDPQGYTLYSSDGRGSLQVWDLRTFFTIRLAERGGQPGAVTELQERLKHPHLPASEKCWLTFSLELARWRQRFDIELSDFEPIQIGEFDIELS